MKRILAVLILHLLPLSSWADLPGVREWRVEQTLDRTYQTIYAALEAHRFFVVFEADIASNLEGFAERWGEDYNRNQLEGIRSLVFCNGWYANQVSNQDPRLLAMCPLRISLIYKGGVTRVLFVRPTHIAAESDGMAVAKDLEAAVAAAVDEGITKAVAPP
jgi:uncharacterized protein (DUF302 family)